MSIGRSDITLKIMIIVNVADLILLLFAVFAMESVFFIAIGALFVEVVSMGLFMKYMKRYIKYFYREQLSDILQSLILAVTMGCIVYAIGRLNISAIILLGVQIIIGAGYYLLMSYLLHVEPFVYVLQLVLGKIRSPN